MLIICLIIFYIPVNVVGNRQCDVGWFFLQKEISCKDCNDYCTKLDTLSADQKEYCDPFCKTKTTPSVIITSTTTKSSVAKTSESTSLQRPNPTNAAIYAIIVLPVILLFVIIGLLVHYRDRLPCRRQQRPDEPNLYYTPVQLEENNADQGGGCKIIDKTTATTSQPSPNFENLYGNVPPLMSIPGDNNGPPPIDEDIESPPLLSMAPQSMAPITASIDPKPIPRDFAITKSRCPELVQSIMIDKNNDNAPSELIQPARQKQVHFDPTKDITDTIVEPNYSSEECRNSVEESSSMNNRDQEHDNEEGPFNSIYPRGGLDSIQPDYSTESPSSNYGEGNSNTIYIPSQPIGRDTSCADENVPMLHSMMSQSSEIDDDPFKDLEPAPPDTPTTERTHSFFSGDKRK